VPASSTVNASVVDSPDRELGSEEMPIRGVTTPEQAVQHAALLAGVEVWTHEPTVADLDGFAAEVEAADR
jgi:hypothetical protein